MNLPKIDALALPDLPEATGVFGSQHGDASNMRADDTLIVLMVFLYDLYEK